MTRAQFEKLQLYSSVVLTVSGVETRVEAIDEGDATFMDSCGGWHPYADADAPNYEY